MGVSEILGILNLVGLLAVAVLLILHLRRRTDGQATAVTAVTAVTQEDLLRSEEKLTGSFRKESEAAVQALQAGCDLLLMPNGLPEAYNAVLQAVKDGTLSEERLDRSIDKILRYKAVFSE